MPEKRSFIVKLKNGLGRMRKDGLLQTLRHYLVRLGIEITPFYYMKEVLPSDIPTYLTAMPEGFEFSVFGSEEVAAINRLSEREDYVSDQKVLDNLKKGDTCLGIKYKGEIVAFTWFSVEQVRSYLYSSVFKANEAYLYDMYVLKAFRGKNLAPILRYRNYEILKKMGRDTFYSVSECSNAASLRFKEKLNARFVFWALYIGLFGKYHHLWVLRRY